MKAVIIIPARHASSRLPGKPLLRETGKYLIQHVYEQACRSARAKRVIVATDDSRIAEAVRSFGGEVATTRSDHPSGTDRIAPKAPVHLLDLLHGQRRTHLQPGNTAGSFPWMLSTSRCSSGHDIQQSSIKCSKCCLKIHRDSSGAHKID